MSAFVKKAILLLATLAILLYTLKSVSLNDLLQKVGQANWWSVLVVGLLTSLTYIVRAERWRQALKPLGHTPSLFNATIAIQTGMIASMIIPASGEMARCVSLQRTDDVPVTHGVGSVIAERVLDLIMLLVVLLVTTIVEFNRMRSFLASVFTIRINWLIVLIVLSIVNLFAYLIYRFAWKQIHHYAPSPNSVANRVITIIKGLKEGFLSLRQLERPGLFSSLTVLNQVFAWTITYVLLKSLTLTQSLPPSAALMILAVSSIGGLAVPTQGGIGTYHFLVSRALLLYSFNLNDGVIIATFLHAVQFGINLLLSSLSFLIIPILITNRKKKQEPNLVK